MNSKTQNHIKYIFETDLDKIDKDILTTNKGLSALCLLYKTELSQQQLSDIFGESVQFNNINTSSVPEFIAEISKYSNIKLSKISTSTKKSNYEFIDFRVKEFNKLKKNLIIFIINVF